MDICKQLKNRANRGGKEGLNIEGEGGGKGNQELVLYIQTISLTIIYNVNPNKYLTIIRMHLCSLLLYVWMVPQVCRGCLSSAPSDLDCPQDDILQEG